MRPADAPLRWRHVRHHLWVADTPSGVAGVLKVGFRYVAVDDAGAVLGRARTLERAQRLLDIA